ncbi:MAG TPA: transaldolase [Acidimicrobiia bacterium]|jgi:transaldolase
MEPSLEQLKVKIFADGADLRGMLDLAANPLISGFTTNPTLMRKAGVTDFEGFAREVLAEIRDRPISFEVFSDDFDEMEAQARTIATWGENVYVKIPVSNTQGEPSFDLLARLADAGVRLNVTALMTARQVREVALKLAGVSGAFISLFAGRVADTGRDPLPVIAESLEAIQGSPELELIWASPRELLNVFQADELGCHVITVTSDILKKLTLVGYDLDAFSLDTVKMFRDDAVAAGYELSRSD